MQGNSRTRLCMVFWGRLCCEWSVCWVLGARIRARCKLISAPSPMHNLTCMSVLGS